MATVTETFSGTNGNLVTGWTAIDTSSSGDGFRIASNTARDDNGTLVTATNDSAGEVSGDVDVRMQLTTLPSGGASYSSLLIDVKNSARSGQSTGDDGSYFLARYHVGAGPGVQLAHWKSGTSDFTTYDTDTSWSWSAGHWLRLTREGNTLRVYASADGSAWTELMSQVASIWTDQSGWVGMGINETTPRIDNWKFGLMGELPITFPIATDNDNGAGYKFSTGWPPTTFSAEDGSNILVNKAAPGLFGDANYYAEVGLLRFNTGAVLPDGATLTGANLILTASENVFGSGTEFDLVGDYYAYDGVPTVTGDWIETASPSIFSAWDMNGLASGDTETIPLTDLSGISTTGYTGIRLTMTAGTPSTGTSVSFASLNNATWQEPRLEVTYTEAEEAVPLMWHTAIV